MAIMMEAHNQAAAYRRVGDDHTHGGDHGSRGQNLQCIHGVFFWKAVSLITLCREGPYWPEGRHRAREKFKAVHSSWGPGLRHGADSEWQGTSMY